MAKSDHKNKYGLKNISRDVLKDHTTMNFDRNK